MKNIIGLFITAIALSSCTHNYSLISSTDTFFAPISTMTKVDLDDYDAFYNVIFRDENNLEIINPAAGGAPHLTDLQYFLISRDRTRFIHISYIPVRYTEGNGAFYMDNYLINYATEINTFYINQLHYGTIENGNTFRYTFSNTRYNRRVTFSIVGNNLTLGTINYDTRTELNTALATVVHPDHLTYTRMANFNLTFHGISEGAVVGSYDLEKNIILTMFDRSPIARIPRNLGSAGAGKNMIIFSFQPYQTINGTIQRGFFFGETAERFKFR